MAIPPLEQPGPFARLMDGLEALERTINEQLPAGTKELVVYRWRTRQLPDLPAIYNWLPSQASAEKLDTAANRDAFPLSAYVGIEHSDDVEQLAAVELYADVACQVFDLDFRNSPFLGGAAQIADRTGRRLVVDSFGDTPVLCVELPLRLLTHQLINPQ
jgi:hypothetical protein